MNGRSIRKRIAFGSIVYGLGGMLLKSISILLVPIYTRVLSTSEYGILSSVNITAQLLAIFMGLSLSASLIRFHFDQTDPVARRRIYGTLFLSRNSFNSSVKPRRA